MTAPEQPQNLPEDEVPDLDDDAMWPDDAEVVDVDEE